jgi:2-methylisocitrate lyase-like PEP mutase family enzyme
MTEPESDLATRAAASQALAFHALHGPGRLLVLANAWDAGSARLIEACGAEAIATTSAGLAWSRGHPDGNALPPPVLARAVAEIARVVSVPLSVDAEGGYSADPAAVGETIAAVLDGGAVGVNLEDGGDSPELLCAKIDAAKTAAERAGVDLFVNARTDVYLRGLVPPERAVEETVARVRRYADAGADGAFVPRLAAPDAIRSVASEISLPLNVLVVPGLAPIAELRPLGVRRVSAGSAIAQASYAVARRAATQLLEEGRYEALYERIADYGEMNRLFRAERA